MKRIFLARPVSFEKETSSSNEPSSDGSGSSGGSGSSDSKTGESNDSSKKSNIGPVAGGIVGGCVVVLGVMDGWLFLEKEEQKQEPTSGGRTPRPRATTTSSIRFI